MDGLCFFFFKQKTAYEMRISDWSSDVCSSDLTYLRAFAAIERFEGRAALSTWLTRIAINEALGRKRAAERRRASLDGNSVTMLEIGSASVRERVCPYVVISVVAGSLKKKNTYSYATSYCTILVHT